MDVALASCLELPEADHDEQLLLRTLRESGIEAAVLPWDDPEVSWSEVRMTVLRSTWNYQLDRDAFLEWARATSMVSELWNGLEIVRWNSHKKYLLDLKRSGIPITPTEFVPQGETIDLETISATRGWGEVVIKPAVSASSYRTLRANQEGPGIGEDHLRELAADGDALVQEYLPSVEGYGERSLIWIDGELTHAVRKSPRFSGEAESVSKSVEISGAERKLAERTIEMAGDLLDEPLLYARIDLASGPDGSPVVMELELIEPSLYLKQSQVALDRFANAILRNLNR